MRDPLDGLDVTETLTIEGQGASLTTIDGNDLDRVLHFVFSPISPPDPMFDNSTLGVEDSAIVYNPLAAQECEMSAGGVVASLGSTLDRDGSCASGAAGDQPSVDPRLESLADNGGPTDAHRML